MHEALRQFQPVIGRWFEERMGVPTPPQILGWPVIGGRGVGGVGGVGKSCLILAPTGSGKTLAAFLAGIDWLAKRLMAEEEKVWGVQILYVSPLKALANDVRKNLVSPLAEIGQVAAGMKVDWPEIEVAVRTGDTPRKERAAMAKKPPHILITTPESLNLMLTSGMRNVLSAVRFLIVDEVHALAGNKRGVFLSLVLERLEEERRRMINDQGSMTNEAGRAKQRRGVKIAPGVYVGAEEVGEMVRVGLSATARPEELIGRWLAGRDDAGNWRPMEVVRSGQRKRLDLGVVCPFGGAEEEGEMTNDQWPMTNGGREAARVKGTGHWPEVTRAVLRMIRDHRSTLVFGNSRRLVERLAARFDEELAQEVRIQNSEVRSERVPVILPHHGSIAKEVRLETEQALKCGEVDAVLATSSLELGIDVGALDLVVQIDSPGNVASALQRVGRAGHLEKATAKGRLLARGLGELGSLAALVPLMVEGVVEDTRVPLNCLDVLAQQVVAACVVRPWKRGDLYRMFRRAMPYAGLAEKQFDSVIAMLSKKVERVTSQGLRPRLSFDRVNDELIIMPGAASVLMMNSGVISDTGAFAVYVVGARKGKIEVGRRGKSEVSSQKAEATGARRESERLTSDFRLPSSPGVRIGELDEEFVYETKEGDRIVLGSQTWRVVRIDADRVLVEHAEPGSSRMPFWRGEQAPRSEMVGEAVGRFYGEVERRMNAECEMRNAELRGDSVREWLVRERHFDELAAENAEGFYSRQMLHGKLPTMERVVVEHFVDRTGEPIIAILCPLGSRVNYTLRLALEAKFSAKRLPAQLVHGDDGIIIRPPVEVGAIPENPLAWLRAGTIEAEIVDQLESSSLFGLRFRQNAARALMLPRMNVTQRTPLWQQRLRGRHLLALVKKERNFPIIVETYREILQDVLGIEQVRGILGQMERGQMAIEVVRNTEPSPFARSLFSQFQQHYLYAWDDPLLTADVEPAVDQVVLDEILRQRGEEGAATDGDSASVQPRSWEDVDEDTLLRRIMGSDYPARSSEELLEKIEAAGAVGIALGLPDDERWGEWVVGGMEVAREMLTELSGRRRLLLVDWGRNPGIAIPGLEDGTRWRWMAAENLALLIAALGRRPALKRWDGQRMVTAAWKELPGAILVSQLGKEEARRVIVEQAIKRRPVTSVEEVQRELPWMGKAVDGIVQALLRTGFVQEAGAGRIVWTEYAEQLRSLALRRLRRAATTADVPALQRHLLHWQHVAEPREGVDGLADAMDMLVGMELPLELWELEVLPARVKEFSTAMLDGLCAGGQWVWVGSGGADGMVSFWPRHLLGVRSTGFSLEAKEQAEACTPNEDAAKILEFLKQQGASFLLDIQIALSLDDTEAAVALEQLAFAGKVSNDQLEGLREVMRLAHNERRDRRNRPDLLRDAGAGRYPAQVRRVKGQRHLPGGWWKQRMSGGVGVGGGRWFVLPEARTADTALELTQRAADRTERLLRRTGFACRELLAPEVDGPWRNCYDVLTRMEWAGSVRRGYFVEGIGGSQFAAIGVRLESSIEAGANRPAPTESVGLAVVWLSMLDPANVWARVNPRWSSDAGEAARVPRAAGNWIALVEGQPVMAAVNWGHRLIPLPAEWAWHEKALLELHVLLARMPASHRGHLDVRQWDQADIVGSPADEVLRRAGFTRDTQGLRLYRQYVIK